MDIKIQIPEIPEEEQTPTVKALLNIISQCVQIIEMRDKEIQLLKDEIARVKGRSPRPKIKASKLEEDIVKKAPRSRKDRQKKKKKSTTKSVDDTGARHILYS
jgi:predicted KAP-like P-loop ATPase